MIDTHCHLDSPRFDADRPEVVARARARGVRGLVVPAVGPAAWEPLLELARREPMVKVGLGIHPQLLPELPESEDAVHLARLATLLRSGGASAIGECGLDGGIAAAVPMDRQVSVLKAHLDLGRVHRLPVLVHCLHAHPALVELLKEQGVPAGGLVLHSYSGSAELVRFYAPAGCHFSFAGTVTFPTARRPLEAARAVPADRLLVETDAPDQAPHPHRGTRCEPAHLVEVVAALAKARGEGEADLATLTDDNAARLFGPFQAG